MHLAPQTQAEQSGAQGYQDRLDRGSCETRHSAVQPQEPVKHHVVHQPKCPKRDESTVQERAITVGTHSPHTL